MRFTDSNIYRAAIWRPGLGGDGNRSRADYGYDIADRRRFRYVGSAPVDYLRVCDSVFRTWTRATAGIAETALHAVKVEHYFRAADIVEVMAVFHIP